MNQVAFATVILRLIGFYIVYDLIAGLAMGAIIQQALFIPFDEEGKRVIFLAWIGVGVLTRVGVAFALIVFADRISRFLFSENKNVITDGAINGSALFWVGLCLMGFYFLIAYFPALVEYGFNWFRAEAADTGRLEFTRGPHYSPIEPLAMTISALFLIFKSKTISAWVTRVSK